MGAAARTIWQRVDRLCGLLGHDGAQLTLAELVDQAEGRLIHQWDHTAAIVATLVNVNRGKNKPPISPAEIHPIRRRQRRAGGRFNLDRFAKHLTGKNPPWKSRSN